jgi:hypothetical protein
MLSLALPLVLAGCVSVPTPTSDSWADFTQTTRAGPVLVEPLRLIEDSRCPANARCIWAGQVVIEARITEGDKRSVAQLTSAEPFAVAGGTLTLDAINPVSFTTNQRPAKDDYEFHFTFEPAR